MKLLKWLFLLLMFGAIVGVGAIYFEVQALSEQTVQSGVQDVRYEVKQGQSALSILNEWQGLGWIKPSPLYRVYFRLYPEQSLIKSGVYNISPHQSLRELLLHIVKGDVLTFTFTIVEGWNMRELRAALKKDSRLVSQLSAMTDAELMIALDAAGVHPEGQFFPDTYRYLSGESDVDLLRRAHQRLKQQLTEAWANRAPDLPYSSPYDALIMASIIEKETGVAGERPDIAGVFVRRLKNGMRLQTDPTVIYGMGVRYNGNIRKKDLQTDTEYNTYTRGGLPPTPIAMAGRAAMDAALNPASGNALFFVARGDGSHVFSDTLEQHNQAVADYLRTLKKRKH